MTLDTFETFGDFVTKTHGARIQLNDFIPSLGRRLKFSVWMDKEIEAGVSNIVDLILCECDRYCGPFDWKNSKLQIIDSDGCYILFDPSVGFEVSFHSACFQLPFLDELEKYGQRHAIAFSGREHVDIDRLLAMDLDLPAKCVELPSKEYLKRNHQPS